MCSVRPSGLAFFRTFGAPTSKHARGSGAILRQHTRFFASASLIISQFLYTGHISSWNAIVTLLHTHSTVKVNASKVLSLSQLEKNDPPFFNNPELQPEP